MRVMRAVILSGVLLTGTIPGWAASAQHDRAEYLFPPDVKAGGMTFAGVGIPLNRPDVSQRVVDQINYLMMDRRASMMEWMDRMAVFGPMISAVLTEEKVPEDLLYLCAILSEMLPNATTRSGGVGWWVLGSGRSRNSSSAAWVSTNDWDDRRDPVISSRIAAKILRGLIQKNGNTDWLIAIASFLDGADSVESIAKKGPGYSFWDLVMPHYSEQTMSRLVALKMIDTHRDFYALEIPRLPQLSFDSIDQLKLAKDLPLYVVANWCGTNPRQIWEFNPGVDPSSGVLPKMDKRFSNGFLLRVPKGKGQVVQRMLTEQGYVSK